MASEQPLIVIVGPTASGKTALAIEIAEEFNGEIICADSRTVYAGMDIGTAKPTIEEQGGIPHWGLDLVAPNETYSVGRFQVYAQQKVTDIRQRGRMPILVGGTGLYIDSIIFDYEFPQPPDEAVRAALEGLSREQLYKYCVEHNIELPINDKNKRHLIQAALRQNVSPKMKTEIENNIFVVGIATQKYILDRRIAERTEHMFAHGVVEEATKLGKKYGWDAEAMTSNVYRLIRLHLEGELSLTQVKEKFTTRDRQLAKRQMTWFRRNPSIEWCSLTEASAYLKSLLAQQ